jgi:hypothetical protein
LVGERGVSRPDTFVVVVAAGNIHLVVADIVVAKQCVAVGLAVYVEGGTHSVLVGDIAAVDNRSDEQLVVEPSARLHRTLEKSWSDFSPVEDNSCRKSSFVSGPVDIVRRLHHNLHHSLGLRETGPVSHHSLVVVVDVVAVADTF